ncbi:MAG: tetratricopeptide repeat protein [Anaerolineae bacterium]|nr:tetratricopeptide repeat protein [Anaerolineae bacterium]
MICTFYSYKGGVGRTMALANIAELYYQAGFRVLMVDWDLEAPGLERFFPAIDTEQVRHRAGIIDMLADYKRQITQKVVKATPAELIDLDAYITPIRDNGRLALLTAGRRGKPHFAQYARMVLSFDWQDFYENWGGGLFFNWLRDQLSRRADIILIDSRTGVTEMGGVCTYHLADTVIMFCASNEQNLEGTLEMAGKFTHPDVLDLRQGRPLELLIIPARVDDWAEAELHNWFRTKFTANFNHFLPPALRDDVASLWALKIPYVPLYAYYEKVAVRDHGTIPAEDTIGTERMLRAFNKLAEVILKLDQTLLADERAVKFYLSRTTWSKTESLLKHETLEAFYQAGQASILNDWLSKFPLPELEKRPRLLLLWGQMLIDDFGEHERAMTLFKLAQELFQTQGDPVRAAEAQVWQSVGLRMTGRAKEAVALATAGLDQLKTYAEGNIWLIAWATRNRGLAFGTAGNILKALEDTRRALDQFTGLNDKHLIGLCHHDLGVSLERQANLDEAKAHYQEAVNIWQDLDHDSNLANSLIGLGTVLSKSGHYERALANLTQALEIALRTGAKRRAAFALAGIGEAHLGQGSYQSAANAFVESTRYADEVGAKSLTVANEVNLSECFYRSFQADHLQEALSMAYQARQTAGENGLIFEKGLACILEGQIRIRLQEYASSYDLFHQAVTYFSDNHATEQVIKAELWWAYGLLLNHHRPDALQHLERAISLIPGDAITGPKKTIAEIQALLAHFVRQPDTPTGVKQRLQRLVQ